MAHQLEAPRIQSEWNREMEIVELRSKVLSQEQQIQRLTEADKWSRSRTTSIGTLIGSSAGSLRSKHLSGSDTAMSPTMASQPYFEATPDSHPQFRVSSPPLQLQAIQESNISEGSQSGHRNDLTSASLHHTQPAAAHVERDDTAPRNATSPSHALSTVKRTMHNFDVFLFILLACLVAFGLLIAAVVLDSVRPELGQLAACLAAGSTTILVFAAVVQTWRDVIHIKAIDTRRPKVIGCITTCILLGLLVGLWYVSIVLAAEAGRNITLGLSACLNVVSLLGTGAIQLVVRSYPTQAEGHREGAEAV